MRSCESRPRPQAGAFGRRWSVGPRGRRRRTRSRRNRCCVELRQAAATLSDRDGSRRV